MNHHTAAQSQADQRWRYVSLNSRGGYPLGYCRQDTGHLTEAGARECFARYQRDNIRLDGQTSNWNDCRECRGPAKQYARIEGDAYRLAILCPIHLTTELAVKHLHLEDAAGDSWES